MKDDTPIVIVQHGLTGGSSIITAYTGAPVDRQTPGSYEPYVRAVLSRACAPVEKGGLGYRAVVINFRGCE